MAATAQLLTDLAEDLSQSGHNVTALAGKGTYAAGSNGVLPKKEIWHGITIQRVRCTNYGRKNSLGRMCDYLTFLLSAALSVTFGKQHDFIVCLSTPPFIAILGLFAERVDFF